MFFKSACLAAATVALTVPAALAFVDGSAPQSSAEPVSIDVSVLHEKAETLRTKARLAAASPGGRETAEARTEEATRLLGYAARLESLASDVEAARTAAIKADRERVAAERAAIEKIILIRADADSETRESVLGDLISTVNFSSGTRSRPLDISFCIQTDGYEPHAFRDLIKTELAPVLTDGDVLIAPTLTVIDDVSLHITASVPPGDTSHYLSVMDDVRAGVLDAAMKSQRPGRAQALVLSGDFAGAACSSRDR